jgi:hypothetical protein
VHHHLRDRKDSVHFKGLSTPASVAFPSPHAVSASFLPSATATPRADQHVGHFLVLKIQASHTSQAYFPAILDALATASLARASASIVYRILAVALVAGRIRCPEESV